MLDVFIQVIIAIVVLLGVVIAATLTLQFANNASRNMSLTNTQATQKISKVD